jgi:anti-sigma B factor antagonist
MKIDRRQEGSVTVIVPHGKIIMRTGADLLLHGEIKKALDEGAKTLVVDLSDVSFIDSSGVGELVAALTSARKSNVALRLSCITTKIHDLLTLTDLLRHFEVYETTEEAVKSS